RGHLSRNFNLPTFNDRFWLALGQPELRPEKGYSADAGWTFQRKKFQLELTGFQLLIDDWILWQPGDDGQFRPANLRKVWSRGAEAAGQLQAGLGRWHFKLSARGQRSATTNVAVYGGAQGVKDKHLPYTPRQLGSVALQLRRGGFSAGYLHQFTGRRYATGDNVDILPGFQTGQLLLRQTWSLGRRSTRISVDLRIENVWNTPYQILAYRPMPGRSGRIGLGVAW
ncbi:MAG: TonB-dependent receptor, partial [Saprospiraceae bacterium]